MEVEPANEARDSFQAGSFRRPSSAVEDEEALKWIALDKLPTFNRLRTVVLSGAGGKEVVDVTQLRAAERERILNKVLQDNNERFLRRLRDRIDKVGIDLPRLELRFEELTVDADVYVGGRALPTLFNFVANRIEEVLGFLWLSPTKKRALNILNNVSGIVRPCRLTLLLGPPNSGKTTLLKALAAKLDPDLRVSGKITYNGHEFSEFVPHRTSAYISQTDLHLAELTVRETIDFSARCQGVGHRYEMLLELSRREKALGIKPDPDVDAFMKAAIIEGQETSIVTDYVMKIMGLDICANTLVGDQLRRGISGGQRKRLTTAEILVGPAKALLMDEISTGLDSSTTYQIVKHLSQTVHITDATILVSLLQPAPEVYNLFDDLILLSEGYIVYQGPLDSVLEFFESLGFKCPERKGVADFLQEITSRKDQEQYWADKSREYRFISVQEFSSAFKNFHVGKTISEDLKVPFDKAKSHPAALVAQPYGISNWKLFQACVSREIILMKRNAFIYVFKTIQIVVMATICMTVFLRTHHHVNLTDGILLVGALFYAIIIIMFNGFSELALTVHRLPVLFKQRGLLYPAWAFALPTNVIRIPFSFLEVSIWILLTYYVIGYASEFVRFLKQYFLLLVLHNMAMGLFRFLASVARSLVVATTFGSFSLLVVFVLGGFIISKDEIHSWWVWGYWVSPLTYAQNAIAVNEFRSPKWNVITGNATEPLGVLVLKARSLYTEPSMYWISIGALAGFTVFFNLAFVLATTFLKPLGKPQVVLSEDSLDEKHANRTGELSLMPAAKSMNGAGPHGVHETSVNISDSSRKGMVLPFKPLSIAFHRVNYFIDMPAEIKQTGATDNRLQLLRNVSGAFRPGILTALVGVSGAGKTTLMDVLAGRKTGGYIEGSIKINGYPKKQETFARISGYCEQNDIHSPYVTVHESLLYSAWLRLSNDVDRETRMMFVDEVMELVELTCLRKALVGIPGVSGLSVEQRKRLTVAVELVANPSIIFMDEPTSGLDARAAAIVMRTVRNTVDTGRTVVCTVHQPSIDIFEAFDELMLMKRGGQLIYAGPLGYRSESLIHYFQSLDPGIPRIVDGYNPATWMLDVTTEEMEAKLKLDFASVYEHSSLFQQNEALIAELSTPPPDASDLHFSTKYAQPFFIQCEACLWKQHWSYWRNPHYNVVRLFFTTICALLFGTIFWGTGSRINSEQQLFNVMGSMYAAVLFIGVNNCSSVQPVVGIERTVFYRERAAGMYSAFPYAFAQAAIEIPYIFVQSVIYLLIVYSMIGYAWVASKFFFFLFFMYFTFLYFTFYGMMVIALTPNFHVAAVASSAFFGLWNLFSGFLISRPRIPVWWRWYYWCDPVAWTLNGLITSQLGDKQQLISVPGVGTETVKHFLKRQFGFHTDFLGVTVAVHIGLVVVFATVFAFCIRTFNFQRR